MQNIELLAEIEDTLRAMPPKATLRHDTPENHSWLGRAVAAINLWDSGAGQRAVTYVDDFHSLPAHEAKKGYLGLMVLLNQAYNSLRLQTLGPVNVAIGQGLVFDYFDELRKIITLTKNDILFVDPYLDADFVSRFLPQVRAGVSIRLLGRKMLASLVPAAKLFVQQTNGQLEVRSAPNFHDRYLFIDGTHCYQSGASFKDGGRTSPTTITQITDAFTSVHQTYESLWLGGKREL
jgi:hypothetical protein